jgi:hypothetical protein
MVLVSSEIPRSSRDSAGCLISERHLPTTITAGSPKSHERELHIQVGETSVDHPPIRCDLCGQSTGDVESHLLGKCPVLQD